ncbi:MAG: (2Fe-2S)-binding protein [Deltaproteobacteria bacterium]|nr:(2Fe-2S)-binding protein [Deltaproteobacteria bacterium]
MRLNFSLNGERIEIETRPDRRVLDLLREDLKLTGTKEACGSGECGACTIIVNQVTRPACLLLAAQLEDCQVTTIEGLALKDGTLHSLQEAFIEGGAIQCGFCTPGMVLTAYELLARKADPNEVEIRTAISGNLCRCTGYQKIIESIQLAARRQGESA